MSGGGEEDSLCLLPLVRDRSWLDKIWCSALVATRDACMLPHLDTLEIALEVLRRILTETQGATFTLERWSWLFERVLFQLHPVTIMMGTERHLQGQGQSQARASLDQRAFLCISTVTQILLHHMSWLSSMSPDIFTTALLKLVRCQATFYR